MVKKSHPELDELKFQLKVEKSLDRVRHLAMRMKESNDLKKVVRVLFDEMDKLDFDLYDANIGILDKKTGDLTYYGSGLGGVDMLRGYMIPFQPGQSPYMDAIYTDLKKGKKFNTFEFSGQVLDELKDFYITKTKFGKATEGYLNGMLSPEYLVLSYATMKYGLLEVAGSQPLDTNKISTLKLFAGVLELTYTRFCDLQKAEEQAREEQIETALERIRVKAMAMRNSNELIEVANTLREQMRLLGQPELESIFVILYDEKNFTEEEWFAFKPPKTSRKKTLTGSFKWRLDENIVVKKLYKIYKSGKGEAIFDVKGQDLKEILEGVMEKFPAYIEYWDGILPNNIIHYVTRFSGGHLLMTSYESPAEQSKELQRRVTKAFDLAFKRFLDLKKTEEQAREAEIQLALERVRARTMAMHRSAELREVVNVFFEQLQPFGFAKWGFQLRIINEDQSGFFTWLSSPAQRVLPEQYFVPTLYHWALKKFWTIYKNQVGFDTVEVKGEDKLKFDLLCFEKSELKNLPDNVKENILSHDYVLFSCASMKYGLLEAIDVEHIQKEEIDILMRFAKVFEQTYTRFLDLQKAEVQAREAEIQLALERVRAKTMAMQNSTELAEASFLMANQVWELGIKAWGCAFHIYADNEECDYEWFSNKEGYLPFYKTPREKFFKRFYEKRQTGETLYIEEFKGKACADHYKYLMTLPVVGQALKDLQDSGISLPTSQIDHVGYFNRGYLLFITYEPVPEAHDIFKRFAKEFEQTYTRFLDLQKAESQAREAQIEASLEKIRSRTMAMHKSEELREVVYEFFEQLQPLGLAKWGFQLRIAREDKNGFNIWISTPAERILPDQYHIPTLDHWVLRKYWDAYEQQQDQVIIEVTGDDKLKLDLLLFEKSDVKNFSEEVKKSILAYDYVQFSVASMRYGLLEAIDVEPIPEDKFEILKRFAKVFEQTYTRFLDLQKAEVQAREAQIETALERVRAQAMAMHHTEDLGKTIRMYYEQLAALINSTIIRCGAGLLTRDHTIAEMSTASRTPDGEIYDVKGSIDMRGHPLLENTYEHWLKQEEYYYVLHGAEINEYYQFITNQVAIPENSGDEELHFYFPMFSEGSFYVVVNSVLPEEELEVFRRFSSVLSLTYRRFSDLKKAEAQAREAQIEAALERIRSKALAMQSSADLPDVSIVLREQMGFLGQQELESSIIQLYNSPETLEAWYTFRSTETNSSKVVTDKAIIPVNSCDYIRETIEKYNSKETEYTIVSEGKKLVDWYHVMVKVAPDTIEYDGEGKMIVPEILHYHYSKFTGGALLMISNEKPSEESRELQGRAAIVFNLAYQRFLDLQQAEERARESVKQASLDRVRAEIASMRTTDDLNRITPIVWKELTMLGVPFFRCGVFIVDDNDKKINVYLSNPEGESLAAWRSDYNTTPLFKATVDHWVKQKAYRTEWNKNDFVEFTNTLIKHNLVNNPQRYQAGREAPSYLALQMIPFKQGMLYVGSAEKLDDERIALVKSLADAFSVAYARYEDFRQLEEAKMQTENTLSELRSTQTQLIHAEKMASLGELTAGIAHEIQNPLNFVNNFSEVSNELVEELKAVRRDTQGKRSKLKKNRDDQIEDEIISDVGQNLQKIKHHGERASEIVKSMLQHSRTNTGEKELTDINALCDEYLRLAYHGKRAKNKSFNAEYTLELDSNLPKINVIPQDIGRVLLNLINNAFQAGSMKLETGSKEYKPEVIVTTKAIPLPGALPAGRQGVRGGFKAVQITIKDNGPGIPENIRDKIFQPFFTTKPTGQGTGLGLSLSYDIVMMHNGTIQVFSRVNDGTEFIIVLPTI